MSRTIEKEVFIKAAPADVWQALTDAEQLTRWFPVHARVEGGPNGTIWLSWGNGAEGEAPITAWEPERRFGWTESRGPVKLVVDFHLQPRDGGTVVRLVQSGFGDGPDWDAEFHMTEGGWAYFVEHLRVYLERHRGTPRTLVAYREPLAMSPADAYERLTTALGFGVAGPGDAFEATTADGDVLTGIVLARQDATGQMGVLLDRWQHALLFLEMEPGADGCRAGFWISTYGLTGDQLADVRSTLGGLYTRALET